MSSEGIMVNDAEFDLSEVETNHATTIKEKGNVHLFTREGTQPARPDKSGQSGGGEFIVSSSHLRPSANDPRLSANSFQSLRS